MVADRLGGGLVERGQVALEVHPADDMYLFSRALTATPSLGVMAYFRAGLQIYDTIEQIITWYFGGFDNVEKFCDFACGYGRSTRFLSARMEPSKIWGVEILPEAVEFQGDVLGVHAVQSATDPDDLELAGPFDMVFVSSLFSHLPGRTFSRWLDRLHALLAPRGLLVVSVHDVAILDEAEHGAMPEEGILFVQSTEVAALDTADYGATFVTPAYMQAAIEALADPAATHWRLPQALCFEQDLYLIPKGEPRVTAAPEIGRGCAGAVDHVAFASKRVLSLDGWAACLDAPGARVSLWADGTRLGTVEPSGHRPDVAAHLRSYRPDHLASGWQIDVEVPRALRRRETVLSIYAEGADGAGPGFQLHCAPLGVLCPMPSIGQKAAYELRHLRGVVDKTAKRLHL